MKAKTFVVEKQIAWAKRRGIPLIAGPARREEVGDFDGQENRTAYTTRLEDNLFEPLSREARADFESGDGDELGEKMQALYSSSALACNLFHHLRNPEHHCVLLDVLGLKHKGACTVGFEQKRRVMEKPRSSGFQKDPNLDVCIRLEVPGHLETAIECKFREPWSGKSDGLKEKYFETTGFWIEIPNLHAYAKRIGTGKDAVNQHLHAAQLIKHILGLTYENRAGGKKCFELIYLWFEVPGDEGATHRRELAEFAVAAKADGIRFRPLACQDFILQLHRHRSRFPDLVDYLGERYL